LLQAQRPPSGLADRILRRRRASGARPPGLIALFNPGTMDGGMIVLSARFARAVKVIE
jgi:hypothetical protein